MGLIKLDEINQKEGMTVLSTVTKKKKDLLIQAPAWKAL